MCIPFAGVPLASWPSLPIDPLLVPSIPSLPSLLSSASTSDVLPSTPAPSMVVAEGMPPLPIKLVEKIRRWEFVDLSSLLEENVTQPAELTVNAAGQWILSDSGQRKKRSHITDILSWIQAFSRFMAVLLSDNNTTKEEATGLAAHLHLVLQLSNDLGTQWLKYDKDFREWAAAKSLRKWGELNFPIYGQCLAAQQKQTWLLPATAKAPHKEAMARKRATPYSIPAVCLKWNFKGYCDRQPCQFAHKCYHCGRPHQGKDCKSTAGKYYPH